MNTQLPYTKHPDQKPVADSLLAHQIKIGKSPEEAVKMVAAYFKQTAGLVGGNKSDGPAGSGNYGGGNASNRADPEGTDWFEALAQGNPAFK